MNAQKLIIEFKQELERKKRSNSTITAYIQDIKQLITFLDNPNVEEINSKKLNSFIRYIIEELGYTKKTASRKLNSINAFSAFLHEKEYIKVNIAKEIKYPEIDTKPPRYLSDIEYKAIRDTARKNIRVYTMIELLLQTGIKISEISKLKIQDVILNNPSYLVINSSNSGNRIVELNKTIQEDLKKYLKNRKNVPNDQKFLFVTRTGKQIHVRNVRTAIDRIFAKAGVKDAHVNDLRNTFIIYQIENGVNIEKIAETVGHRRKATTQKYLKCTKRKKTGNSRKLLPL